MGVPSKLGCSDYARRALVALDFPCSEGGGGDSSMYKVCQKVLYKNTCMHMRTMGTFRQFLEKEHMDKRMVNMEVGN